MSRNALSRAGHRARRDRVDPLLVNLDVASEAGMAIAGTAVGDVAAANAACLLAAGEDDYSSGDDINESEEAQAAALRATLLARLAADEASTAQRAADEEQRDYARNGAVLDQTVVARRLDLLRAFAGHLQKVGKHRAAILARLAEPLAEEHWMLSPECHQQMVDALQGMCGLVNRLPDIAAAAQHCATAPLPSAGEDADPDAADSERQIAQMERLVHEVEQAVEWIQTDQGAHAPLPTFST
ncbi:hypothetical protein IWQ56_004698 [Coemansia nantahalensis]|nr:hypothetical protein IWQ56_004698 [Coemansia nantahalensis]